MRSKPGPPMTLANMRANGVRAVTATWEACGHKADVNVDALPETVTVPKAGERLRCSSCGGKTISTRPAYGPTRRRSGLSTRTTANGLGRLSRQPQDHVAVALARTCAAAVRRSRVLRPTMNRTPRKVANETCSNRKAASRRPIRSSMLPAIRRRSRRPCAPTDSPHSRGRRSR